MRFSPALTVAASVVLLAIAAAVGLSIITILQGAYALLEIVARSLEESL